MFNVSGRESRRDKLLCEAVGRVRSKEEFLKVATLIPGEKVVDLFAGAGGASRGIEMALGRSPDYAVNHDILAIETHTLNHPETWHRREDVWRVNPRDVTEGEPVGLLWASPDCRHFSRAKGGKPVSRRVRSLANVVVKWARDTGPRLIFLENVQEFTTWGPLVEMKMSGVKVWMPDPDRKGDYFRRWIRSLEFLGYKVEGKMLCAADFGAPTSRRRFFLVARRDGIPVRWPTPSHGPGLERPHRAAAEIIDWSLDCPSIFTRKKPLADATLRRIARGIDRYVLKDPRPFIVNLTHGGRVEDLAEPLKTVTGAHRGEKALVAPILAGCGGRAGQSEPRPGSKPMYTITAKCDTALVAASLVQTGYGERDGQAPRALDIKEPLGTVVAGGSKHAIVAAVLKHYTGAVGQDARKPLGTVTAVDHHSILSAHLTRFRGEGAGTSMRDPTPTIVAGHSEKRPGGNGHKLGVIAAHLTKFHGTATGSKVDEPAPTVTGQGLHLGLVYAFITKYFGSGIGQKPDKPLSTVTTKDRCGVVTVIVEGEEYALADIGLRMLQPHELAAAQGFAPGYFLLGTKSDKVRLIGNSVCPDVAAAVIRANLGGEYEQPIQGRLL